MNVEIQMTGLEVSRDIGEIALIESDVSLECFDIRFAFSLRSLTRLNFQRSATVSESGRIKYLLAETINFPNVEAIPPPNEYYLCLCFHIYTTKDSFMQKSSKVRRGTVFSLRSSDVYLELKSTEVSTLDSSIHLVIAVTSSTPRRASPSPRPSLPYLPYKKFNQEVDKRGERLKLKDFLAKLVRDACWNSYNKNMDSFLSVEEKSYLLSHQEDIDVKDVFSTLFVRLQALDQSNEADKEVQKLWDTIGKLNGIEASHFVWFIKRVPFLRFPNYNVLGQTLVRMLLACNSSSLAMFMDLVTQALINLVLLASKAENQRQRKSSISSDVVTSEPLNRSLSIVSDTDSAADLTVFNSENLIPSIMDGILEVVAQRDKLLFSLYWALSFEIATGHLHSSRRRLVGSYMYKELLTRINEQASSTPSSHGILVMDTIMKELFHCLKLVNSSKDKLTKRKESFRELLMDKVAPYFKPADEESLLLSPFDRRVKVLAINCENCTLFSSSRSPALIEMRGLPVMRSSNELKEATNAVAVKLIMKCGDDLRLDHIAILLMSLANDIFLSVGLQLSVRLYGILPTAHLEGAVEFVDATPIAGLPNNSIIEFLRRYNYDASGENLITDTCRGTFIRSCAFFCVLAYVLGIGDRHLDNILICQDGTLVHIDFAFLFGKDPKYSALSAMVRLPGCIVEALGGEQSIGFESFQRFCCLAYNTLRHFKSSIYIAISSLVDSSLPHVSGRENKKALQFVENQLKVNLSDEEAAIHFCEVIEHSVHSVIPGLLDLQFLLEYRAQQLNGRRHSPQQAMPY